MTLTGCLSEIALGSAAIRFIGSGDEVGRLEKRLRAGKPEDFGWLVQLTRLQLARKDRGFEPIVTPRDGAGLVASPMPYRSDKTLVDSLSRPSHTGTGYHKPQSMRNPSRSRPSSDAHWATPRSQCVTSHKSIRRTGWLAHKASRIACRRRPRLAYPVNLSRLSCAIHYTGCHEQYNRCLPANCTVALTDLQHDLLPPPASRFFDAVGHCGRK